MTRGEGADLPSNDTPSAPSAGRRFWINTVSLDHVEGAIEGGFTQADHGANTRLRRPRPGDLMVFYSPRTNLHGGIPVRQFTALATVTGNKPYQVKLSKDFQLLAASPSSSAPLHSCRRKTPGRSTLLSQGSKPLGAPVPPRTLHHLPG